MGGNVDRFSGREKDITRSLKFTTTHLGSMVEIPNMKLNADIGEMTGNDTAIVPYITMANVACGYHASDSAHMEETVRLTLSVPHPIQIGAHVSYRDRENFGRVSIPHTDDEIKELVHAQVSDLAEVCSRNNTQVDYIKPHGALYHDMMMNAAVRDAICAVTIGLELPLVVQAQAVDPVLWAGGVVLVKESFADRAYADDGALVSRAKAGAVHDDAEKIISQAHQLHHHQVMTESGRFLDLKSETLCIHGDNPASVIALKQIHAHL